MIDTVRFRISISRELAELLAGNAVKRSQINLEDNKLEYQNFNKLVNLPSSTSTISLFLNSPECVFLECSLPKQLLGNNIQLLPCSRVEEALALIHAGLCRLYGSFPSYETWMLQRADFCYAWKFETQEQAEQMLKFIKLYDFPRKKRHDYPTTVMFSGHMYSVKFYLKNPEFERNSVKKLRESKSLSDPEIDHLVDLSQGVLRFEVTCRKEQLKYLFSKLTYSALTDQQKIIGFLHYYLTKLLKTDNVQVMTDIEVMGKLKQTYPPAKSARLFTFWNMFNDPEKQRFALVKKEYNHSTIWRNLADLKLAKVGISSELIPWDAALVIPSPLATALGLPPTSGLKVNASSFLEA